MVIIGQKGTNSFTAFMEEEYDNFIVATRELFGYTSWNLKADKN